MLIQFPFPYRNCPLATILWALSQQAFLKDDLERSCLSFIYQFSKTWFDMFQWDYAKMLQRYEEMNPQPYNIPWPCLTLGFPPGKCYQQNPFLYSQEIPCGSIPFSNHKGIGYGFIVILYYSCNKTWHLDRSWIVIYSEVTCVTKAQCSSFPQ